jgi:hypothetical protein
MRKRLLSSAQLRRPTGHSNVVHLYRRWSLSFAALSGAAAGLAIAVNDLIVWHPRSAASLVAIYMMARQHLRRVPCRGAVVAGRAGTAAHGRAVALRIRQAGSACRYLAVTEHRQAGRRRSHASKPTRWPTSASGSNVGTRFACSALCARDSATYAAHWDPWRLAAPSLGGA